MRQVLTTFGEETVSLLRETAGVFRWVDSQTVRPSRIGRVSGRLPATHLFLPRIVSIAEDYCRNLLLDCSEALVDHDEVFHADLWARAEKQVEGSWNAMEEAWSGWFGVEIKEAPTKPAFDGLVVARNSIMHGLGELTKRQRRSSGALDNTRRQLEAAGIALEGNHLIFGPNTIDDAVESSVGLVKWLDYEAIDKGARALS